MKASITATNQSRRVRRALEIASQRLERGARSADPLETEGLAPRWSFWQTAVASEALRALLDGGTA